MKDIDPRLNAVNLIRIQPTVQSEEYAQKYRQLIQQWNDCVAQVRKIPGHSTFAQPPSFSQLQQAAKFGPVVILITGNFHCDALIVRLNEPIRHVPLVGITGEEIARMTVKLHTEALGSRQGEILRGILGTLWKEVCSPVLEALGPLGSNRKQRVWWCPTGQLAFLPIHAAGKYKKNHLPIKSQTMFQRVISSYTASLGQLARAIGRIRGVPSQDTPSLMLVGMKESPHYAASFGSLLCAANGVEAISSIFPPSHATCLLDDTSTSTTVLSGLSSHKFVHFACNGSQNWEVPIESGLLLHDRTLSLLNLAMYRSSVRADLASEDEAKLEPAFLPACETSTGSGILPDQAVHLAAGMQFLGFNTVIATLWRIADELAPQIAKQFYTHLLKTDHDHDNPCVQQLGRDAGLALHEAINNVLESDKSISLWDWVPYVHIGI